MTAPFSARRRADDFEALLSRGPDTPLSERDAAQFAALLDLVADLRAVPDVTPREELVASLRERLMVEADTVLVRRPPAPQRLAMPATSRPRDRRIAALLGGVALVGATATMAVAAQTALPGESLYGVKRGIESAQVQLATDEASRGRTVLAQAETRLTELEELAAGDGGTDQLIPDTLDAFTQQSGDGVRTLLTAYEDGGSEQDVQAARAFTATSMDRLTALQPQLPESADTALLAAGRTLTDLDLEIDDACLSCPVSVTTVPEFLQSSAPIDLLTGLDIDHLTLEAAPVSGQDVSGITIPEVLQTVLPTRPSKPAKADATPTTTTTATPAPTSTSTPTSRPTSTSTPTPQATREPTDPTAPVKTTPDKVKDVTKGVTDTTGEVTRTLDGVTGGALGGLTEGVDNATGGLIGEVTGTLDGLTGNTLSNATGGLLP